MNGADFVDRLRVACEDSNVDPQGLKLMLARFLPEYNATADGVRSGTMATAVNPMDTARLL
jgi:hypothetical protein